MHLALLNPPSTTTSYIGCRTCDLYFPTILESKRHQYHSLGDSTVAIYFPPIHGDVHPHVMLSVSLLTYVIVIHCYLDVPTWFKGS